MKEQEDRKVGSSRAPRAARVLVAASVVLALALGLLHALGARDSVSILSGTMPAGGSESAALGVLYVLAWFGTVVASPPMVVAAALLTALRLARKP